MLMKNEAKVIYSERKSVVDSLRQSSTREAKQVGDTY